MKSSRVNSKISSRLTSLSLVVVFAALLMGIMAYPELAEGAVSLAKPTEPTLSLSLNNAFPSLTFNAPVDIAHAGDNRLFIVEQTGSIKVASLTSGTAQVFLDISGRVTNSGEMGLLGLAFHPNYASNDYFYVNYTRRIDGTLYTFVSRFKVTANENVADPNSELVILRVRQPYDNHNAGDLAFGDDGYLYVGLGDGGSGGDPQNNAQNATTLLGSMLRLDVDGGGLAPDCGQAPANYTIPADNPFVVDNDAKCNEIWATGLRNPWRYSFDRQFHDLYIGDVGQGTWEEINFQPANTGGLNYGWRCYEGNNAYNLSGCSANPSVYTFPIDVYESNNGPCAVTGGFVYRGTWYPEMNGRYFYGDYCSGQIWSVQTDPPGAFPTTYHLDTSYLISTFGEDAYGELYLADRSGGRIYRLQDNNEVAYLKLKKEAPATAVSGQPFTYTLTVQNSGNFTMNNVTLTDTLPTGATYVSGGSLTNGVVSWPAFNLPPYSGEVSRQFVVTATTNVSNVDYRASANGGYEATGTAVVTIMEPASHIYLPSILKSR